MPRQEYQGGQWKKKAQHGSRKAITSLWRYKMVANYEWGEDIAWALLSGGDCGHLSTENECSLLDMSLELR